MPADEQLSTRLYLRQKPNGFLLTDMHWSRRLFVWPTTILIGSIGLIPGLAAIVMLVGSILGVGNSATGSVAEDLIAGAVMFIISLVPILLLAYLFKALKVHRHFTVRVNTDRRDCVCRSKRYGWAVSKREIEIANADWDIKPGIHRDITTKDEQVNAAGCLLAIIIFVTGPLGWLIYGLTRLGRRNRTPEFVPGVATEIALLILTDEQGKHAVVKVAQEQIAEAFLTAWDEAKR